MGKKKEKKGKSLNKKMLGELLIELFEQHPGEELELQRIHRMLALDTHPKKMLCRDILEEMLMDDYVKQPRRYTYCLNAGTQEWVGIFHRKSNGKNTIETEDGGEPILVAERNSMHAMDGDKVKATVLARRRGHVREAAVTEILQRCEKQFVGTLQVHKDYAYLLTEDRTLANDIFIPKSNLKKGKTGDKVVVRIVEWPKEAKNPVGKVVDILGTTGENNAEVHAILAEFGLPYSYPTQVEKAADNLTAGITPEEIARREDMREVLTFTIDPHDAKDFDDALSIRSTGKNLWEVGVHIADVSYYVEEGSLIDREALKRATSIYLVDRTIPMLPERLCNYICSLRPEEEKLCYSVIFHLDEKGQMKDWHLAHTVIRSDRRYAYEDVQEILENTEKKVYEEGSIEAQLTILNTMAQELRRRRFEQGAVDFDREEVRFDIDEEGKPTRVYFKRATPATQLIEEFMLLANRTVAESIGKQPDRHKAPKVFPFRIHDKPDMDKLFNLANFVTKFGYKLKTNGNPDEMTRNLNKLLHDVKGKKEQNVIETVSLRAMMKARYSTHNIGHYGLAFDYYTHFTSPIRRYPDLLVHRLLSRYAEGGRSVSQDKYEQLCEHCSQMEQTAAQAERASIKYKQVEFMSDHLGETYEGTISGVTEFGLYVEINENKCEGFVPLRDLSGDYYFFDEKQYRLVGRRYHRCYNLGDTVTIQVARADLFRKQLDFKLIEKR